MHSTHDGLFSDLPRWKLLAATVVLWPVMLPFFFASLLDKLRKAA